MSKLLEKLHERSLKKTISERPRGAGKQIFLAQRDEIEQAVLAHWPYKEIYDALQQDDAMPITYRSFCTYIWRFITSKQKNTLNKKSSDQPSPQHHLPPKKDKQADNNADTEQPERLPRGLGTSSSVSHQRKSFKPDDEIQESELFNFDNR